MTEQTRRNVFRYGIAIDLVILATGAGMIVPPTATLLIVLFTAAVLLSTWKGGWQGGYVALVLSLMAMVGIFPDIIAVPHLLVTTGLGIAGSAAVAYAMRPRVSVHPMIAPVEKPIAVTPEPEPEPVYEPTFAEKPLERTFERPVLAEVVPLPLEARAPVEPHSSYLSDQSPQSHGTYETHGTDGTPDAPSASKTKRKRRAKADEAAARAAVEAEAHRRKEEERLAAEAEARRREEEERAAAEAEARRLEEEERLAAEAEARRREEEERLAAEAEARRREEEERAAAEAEARRLEEEERLAAEAEARRREEEARLAAEEALRIEEAERLRAQQELEERLAREREQAQRELEARLEEERRAAEAEARRRAEDLRLAAEAEARRYAEEERERVARELEERLAREREEAKLELQALLDQERRTAEQERILAESERRAAEEARQRAEAERARIEQELAEELARRREATQHELLERLEAERRAAEEDLRRQLEAERGQLRARAEQELAAERERIEKASAEQIAAAQAAAAAAAAVVPEPVAAAPAAPPVYTRPAPPASPKGSLLDTVTSWFKPRPRANLKVSRNNAASGTATRRPQASSHTPPPLAARRPSAGALPKPRMLLIERRRATADTVVPKLRHRGVEVEIVERWVDAVDELFRFRPNLLCLDVEHPEFEKIHRTVMEKAPQMPIVLTGRSTASLPSTIRYAAFTIRPYDVEDLTRLAHQAQSRIDDLLAEQAMPRTPKSPPPKPAVQSVAPAHARPAARPGPAFAAVKPIPLASMEPAAGPPQRANATADDYDVTCFSCRVPFDAMDADWCSCLAKERTLVCTNCLACFCKAPPAFKEKFWVEAPPRLFERKTAEVRKQEGLLPANPTPEDVKRPLVLTVEDDEDIQAIVQRVCSNLGYGFIWATNGQDGLDLARQYRPNMILSDAFMPKLDGREMCRMLKEEPLGADIRMVVMTGLYTDTKYRSEAVKRFHVDDYIAKPVAITELINILQRHLEGVTGLPDQEDMHERYRQDVDEAEDRERMSDGDVALADILSPQAVTPGSGEEIVPAPREKKIASNGYDVCCFNCQLNFDATRAEWCGCVGRDNTLVCEHCNGCFCKAPAAYRERFWIDAPPSLFERKMIGSKRNTTARTNPLPPEVKRPLILLVEDDENVQLIVRTVVSSMGYGFVVGANGQEGLTLAREYDPDLILSDAFMPKLDGREMCRLLKEDPTTSRSKAIIMTGLYTDRKYRNEALDYFKVDDYVAKPLAVDDLIKLFKKHLPQEVTMAH
ncbi:MAG TPA: response regulator [Thermoanaerobaculia bacterium]|nr:response regulator [Thermoanaerobaculia bacterium]